MKASQIMMNNIIRKYGMESKQAIIFCHECAKRPKQPEKSIVIQVIYKILMKGSVIE